MGKKTYVDGHIEVLPHSGQILVAYATDDLAIVVDALRRAYREIIEQSNFTDAEQARIVAIRENLYPALVGHMIRARPEPTYAERRVALAQAFAAQGMVFEETL